MQFSLKKKHKYVILVEFDSGFIRFPKQVVSVFMYLRGARELKDEFTFANILASYPTR